MRIWKKAFTVLVGVGAACTGVTSAWATAPPAAVTTASFALSAVSCTSTTMCMAVGDVAGGAGTSTLAELWSATGWSVVPTPSQAGAVKSYLDGVSCPSATFCAAVGYFQDATKAYQFLAETWNGTAWSIVPTQPVLRENDTLASVSCPSVGECIAVGRAWTSASPFATVAEIWTGSAFGREATVNPGGIDASFFSVSCPSLSFCTAVGQHSSSSTSTATLAETWNGTTWSYVTTPNTSPTFGELEGVTCVNADQCTAVGAGKTAIVEAWNGTGWTVQHSFTKVNNLWAASCSGAAQCLAMAPTAGAPKATSAFWNGSAWITRSVQQPLPSAIYQLPGVACVSTTFCMVVGSTTSRKTLAEIWTGTGWKVTQTKF